jgi:glycine dehydrogenase subunit 1
MLVVTIAEAVSLGIVKPPVEADIVAMEVQALGIPLSYGGPYAGVIATKEKYVRQMPGRLAGEARDKQGNRGFVLTLSTREQHIRREKATSNICSNQALVALMANIFMTVYGKEGLKELAKQNLAKTAYAVEQFKKAGAKVLFEGAPRFNEFVVQTKSDPYTINEGLERQHIIGGFPVIQKFYPELGQASLWCCTELSGRAAIDVAAKAVAQ